MPRLRLLMLTASVPIVRSTASSPSVITAMENSGSPIIGRMIKPLDDEARAARPGSGRTTSAPNHTT